MIKKWFVNILAIAFCASALTLLKADETRVSMTAAEMIAEVESSYQKGEYDVFLNQLHEQYQRAGKAGVLRGIFESAKAALPTNPSTEDQKRYRLQKSELAQKRDQRLLEATAEDKKLPLSQRVVAITTFTLAQDYSDVLAELESLKYLKPESTDATVQNKISALETEYYIKSLLLDVASHTSGTSPDELQKKKIALVLKKLDQMEDIAQSTIDEIWIKKIQMAKVAYRVEKAYKVDLEVLNQLAAGKIDPKNSVEEKVKGIMIDFLSEQSTQTEQHLAEIAQK